MSLEKSVNPMLLPISLDTESIRKRVMTNICLMLKNRKLLNSEKWTKQYIENFIQKKSDENVYIINIDKPFPEENENDFEKKVIDPKCIVVKLVSQNITSVGSPIIESFMKMFSDKYKIIIFDKVSERAKKAFVTTNYTEIFIESFFMSDLLSHHCSPAYEVLSSDEIIELKKSYNLDNRKLKKQLITDPCTQYLGLKRGQIIRIIRNSEQACKSIDYRRIK